MEQFVVIQSNSAGISVSAYIQRLISREKDAVTKMAAKLSRGPMFHSEAKVTSIQS
ncbi:MAG: hypothetical protein JWN25_1274 [Verrucomicrobiales bacterium]|nr:hypothetical protein [Verrucomicrobiales bacterium]